MIDLPHRGNMLVVKCRDCDRERRITGREIVVDFTKWLPAEVSEWASTLVCGACQSRFIMVYAINDPGAGVFQESTMDTGQIIWARRINTWLKEVGSDLWGYLDILEGVPVPADLEKAGIRPLAKPKSPIS